jgi:hypothetical protein
MTCPSNPQPCTTAARHGVNSDPAHGAVMPPLYLSSNFSFDGLDGKRPYDYTRSGNPTRDVLGETLAKLEEAQELAEGSTPEEAAKDYQREIKNQQRDHAVILHRATSIRAFITKNLGDLAALKLTKVELDLDDDAPADQPTYDDVDLHLTTADGTPIEISIDDAVQLNGTWKFKDRLEERIAITLPDTPD